MNCKWPTNPLTQVQVTVDGISMMATPDRAYFDAATVNEAVMAERVRCANYCDGERLYNTARALRNGKFARPTANGKLDTSEPVT